MELYKRHRPRSLERVIGNEETVQSLQEMVKGKKVPHTILFSGPSGCGKTTLARILRKELGCHDLDFTEMNCAGFRGIDTIRDIMRNMNLAPTGGPCRVWLLDEVHQMTKDAQDSALKMLEDTPDHVYFFLCTTHPQKLIPTIRNRCMDLPVSLLSDGEVRTLLKRVAKKEGLELTDDTLSAITENADGSARLSLVLLDKVRNLPEESREKAIKVLREEQTEAIELCRALIKKEPWAKVGKILKGMKGDPESTRWAVLGYARSVLLNTKNSQAYLVICAFENPFFDSKEAGLARASYEAIFGG